ncbi:MAG: sensor histidine kinase [Anaerolineales bacterium]|nr:sensor histidine kinase [Anaerolineales bacterium]
MRTIGVYLIFAAVALRGAVVAADEPYFTAVLGLLAAYGLLLFVETRDIHRRSSGLFRSRTSQAIYLLLQSTIVIGLLIVSDYEDFFANLFIPLSLDAVAFFGRRVGYFYIAGFSLTLSGALLFSSEGQLFGLAMGGLYSGVCFLFGGYASQVLKAEAARNENQRAFDELQSAHHQLQGYADQVASLAVERERNRLARELHDSVTQTVFSMNLTAQSARLLLDKESVRASCSVQLLRLEGLAANALSEIQSLVSQLKPRSIAEEGLPAALRRLADERGSRDGLQASLEIHGEKFLSEAEILGLYSIVHEALSNVVKHSGVNKATVRLNLDEEASCLEIEDHGRGFDPQAISNPRGHLGLAGMSERAREIGWNLSVESNPRQGTRILVRRNQAEVSE